MTTLLMATKLIGVGACMGIGFWISKKLTNTLDGFIAEHDEELHKKLMKEMG